MGEPATPTKTRKLAEYFSRKFVLSVLALFSSFYLAITDRELGGWAGTMAVILGFYNGSNVYQDYLHSRRLSRRTPDYPPDYDHYDEYYHHENRPPAYPRPQETRRATPYRVPGHGGGVDYRLWPHLRGDSGDEDYSGRGRRFTGRGR